MSEEKSYQYWLHNIPEAGDRTIEKILKEFGSARQAYFAGADALRPMIRGKGKEKIEGFIKNWDIKISSLCIILSWKSAKRADAFSSSNRRKRMFGIWKQYGQSFCRKACKGGG